MLWILVVLVAVVITMVLIGIFISGPKYTGQEAANFDGKRFRNPSGVSAQDIIGVIKWMVQRNRGAWREITEIRHAPPPPPGSQSLMVTFSHHSAFLIQVDGINILTDPVYSERASPFPWIGPKRMRPPGIPLEHLPLIDYVLISHNHYDHLDKKTVLMLHQLFNPVFITPLGVDRFIQGIGIDNVVSLNWWEDSHFKANLRLISVPAQHFSGRGILDRDATLWCGYVLERADGNIYFAGDSGYDQHIFREIGEKFAPIKLSLIPIGAYIPNWFMAPVHCSPDEAVKIHRDLQSRQSIAMHFGTFPLGDDGQQQPVEDLKSALRAQNISSEEFLVLREGEGRMFE